MSFTGIISGSNGVQGRTTIGPKTVDARSPSDHGDNMAVGEIELQLDGDLAIENLVDFEDETNYALPKGSLVESVKVYSSTGVAALNVGFIDENGNGANTNVLAGANVPGVNWLVVRDIDLAIGADSQIVYDGIAPGEKCVVLISYTVATYEAATDGVLKKHRAV